MINTKDKIDILNTAKKVISIETEALTALEKHLDHDFEKAIHILNNITGRVIISGMGKSGHIGAKIAATLSSTGTPSFFLHPGEASHGDLGMVTPNDAVICLSNSGDTSELSDLIAYTKRYNIPLISIIAKKNSALGKNADISLIIPKMKEACPNGLAPTTSTTMMLCLGDAIAITLMRLKGFTSDHFKKFHPGGKLGTQLMKINDLMHTLPDIPLVDNNSNMQDIVIEITSKAMGCTGVVNQTGELIGIITDGDLRRSMNSEFMEKTAQDIMSYSPITIHSDRLVVEAVSILENNSITGIFIVDDHKKPIGFLHIHDCLRSGAI